MLKKAHRIPRVEYLIVSKTGKRAHSPLFTLIYKDNKETSHSRFSFVVSKKVAKSSPKRHTIKRWGYEIVHKNKDILEKTPPVYAIFIIKPEFKQTSFAAFETQIQHIWKNL